MVETFRDSGRRVVRKTYRPRPLFRWRSLLRRSKAEREFANLLAMYRTGLPVPKPIEWGEHRRFGCEMSSWISCEWVEHLSSLKELLATHDEASHWHARRELASAYGRLLRDLHSKGFVGTTLFPRNILVREEGDGFCFFLCDQPRLATFKQSVHGKRFALVDLFDAAFSKQRRTDFSRVERLRILLAYAGGDRREAWRLWRKLNRHGRSRNRFLKYLLAALT